VPKKYNVLITETAQADFSKLWEYIAADSPSHAALFLNEIEARALSLDLFPERHLFITENELLNTDYRHLVYKDYRIIYHIDADNVFIVRIIHGTMLFS
jgi:toxin ParE1/3/4